MRLAGRVGEGVRACSCGVRESAGREPCTHRTRKPPTPIATRAPNTLTLTLTLTGHASRDPRAAPTALPW
jgi:hypothetical protein